MITVTFGVIPFQFNRAINWVNILLDKEIIDEPLFVQYGVSDVSRIIGHPLVTAVAKTTFKELVQSIQASRLVISHAGQGSTRDLAARDVSFVVLPRLAKYGEHVDDHQLLFAKSVAPLGVQYCLSLQELEESIKIPPPPLRKNLFDCPNLSEHLLSVYPPGLNFYRSTTQVSL